jgi:uncharacterized surface protein with fasciclin (FAS1) repeats
MRLKYTIPFLSLLTALGFTSCIKEEQPLSAADNSRINQVVADNFNLSSFNAALRRSTLDRTLKTTDGPYTVLAPSDRAFTAYGYSNALAVLAAEGNTIFQLANYHLLDGRYELNKLPFLFNQELRSRGGKLFVTHWVKGSDTVLTVNGSRVVAANVEASNGLVQVIDQVLRPYVHDRIGDAIAAQSDITLFSQALLTSGLLETLNGAGPYTVFAPNNDAMIASGYATVQQLRAADPAALRRLVSYHVVRDRRFIYDYILSTVSTSKKQTMMDDNVIDVRLLADFNAPGSYNGIALRGPGNTTDVMLTRRDILTGNGVLHIINNTLRLTR